MVALREDTKGLFIFTNDNRVDIINSLHPGHYVASRLEILSDVNTSYTKWIEDYGITREWIGDFPTVEIYHNYVRYCIENRYSYSMDKTLFYHVLENDFNIRL